MKKCVNCNIEKELSEFYKDSKNREGYRVVCKKCFLIRYPYKVTERGRENWRRYKNSKKGIINCLLNNAKDRAKKNNLNFDLDYEWLESKIDNGKCELSNIIFEYDSRGLYKSNPYSPSIDKIDPKKGYEKSNCRVVCFCVNMSMSDWGQEVLFNMCENLLKVKAITWKD